MNQQQQPFPVEWHHFLQTGQLRLTTMAAEPLAELLGETDVNIQIVLKKIIDSLGLCTVLQLLAVTRNYYNEQLMLREVNHTPGGLFLKMVKHSTTLTAQEKKFIFRKGKKNNRRRRYATSDSSGEDSCGVM